jgi:hypothetical protein
MLLIFGRTEAARARGGNGLENQGARTARGATGGTLAPSRLLKKSLAIGIAL